MPTHTLTPSSSNEGARSPLQILDSDYSKSHDEWQQDLPFFTGDSQLSPDKDSTHMSEVVQDENSSCLSLTRDEEIFEARHQNIDDPSWGARQQMDTGA